MPKDNVERAIRKAGEAGDTNEVMYEAYGPAGIGMIITGLTDNTNRTNQDIKTILTKNGGTFGATGSVAWNFTQDENRDWIPNAPIDINEENKNILENIIELLSENDDIQDIFHAAHL
jgi:transcriptional/translational regulatory protein YebC/TACO1